MKITAEEKAELLRSLRFFIFLMLVSLLFLFASSYVGGGAYIFAIVNSFWFLGAASVAPSFSKNESAPPAVKDWKIIAFVIFGIYAALVSLSGYGNLYIPITFCVVVLVLLIALSIWTVRNT